ncbi:MAG: carboxylesterase family protein [Bacteroidetes bacterium]|nr:carboxylesterase family protein [Bacteroidota bacterium]
MNCTPFFFRQIQKTFLAIVFLFTSQLVSAQYCTGDNRFTEQEYFTDAQLDSMKFVVYRTATNWNNVDEDLQFNVYFPKNSIDPLPMRPFILLIHGGGFTSGSKIDLNDDCIEFAKRGFVAATIDYRLGHTGMCDSTYDNAVYRALQDANAAFEYVADNAALLKIDTSWMFVGGGSAGAGTSLALVYLSQDEWNSYHPYIQPLLGDLKSPGFDYSIKAIFNNWGGALSTSVEVDEMVPMIAFHGDADPTVDIDSSASCSSLPGSIEYGSATLHTLLTNAGVCSELNIKPGGGHGIYIMPSAFRVGRAVCFFKSVFCDNCTTFITTDSIPASCSGELGITAPVDNGQVVSYPNPTNDMLYLNVGQGDLSEIAVFTLTGQKIPAAVVVNGETIQIDFSAVGPGVYLLEFMHKGERQQLRVVKQ